MVASPPRWHGPQVRAPEHHGAMGPSTSWDPWPRPAARAAVGMQECTQIGEDGLSTQPPPACRGRPLVRPTRKVRLSVTSPVQNAPLGHVAVASSAQSAPFRESDTPRVRLSVSRRLQSGAHVHAVATRFAEASTHTNPRRATFVHVFTVKALVLVDAKRIDRTGHFCPTTAALERRMRNSV